MVPLPLSRVTATAVLKLRYILWSRLGLVFVDYVVVCVVVCVVWIVLRRRVLTWLSICYAAGTDVIGLNRLRWLASIVTLSTVLVLLVIVIVRLANIWFGVRIGGFTQALTSVLAILLIRLANLVTLCNNLILVRDIILVLLVSIWI